MWLEGVLEGARARLRPSLTRCKQALRGISTGEVESEEVYLLEWHQPPQQPAARKSKRKQKKKQQGTYTGGLVSTVDSGPYSL